MKTKQTILKTFASVALVMGAFAGADAQSNLGASCGCPAVSARTIVLMSDIPGYAAISGTFGGQLNSGATLTCDKTYILDKKIYIPAGQTLNIAPGTVIKGRVNVVAAEATALTIMRGGKINASGTESCPIVFTAEADPMDGTYSISNTGMWGGVVLLGKASNNLTLAANGPFVPGGAGKLAVADGLGTVEGFASSNPQDQYGVATTVPNAYTSSTSPGVTSYSFDVQNCAHTSNANDNKQRFNVTGDWTNFILNGMTISGGGWSGSTVTVNSVAYLASTNISTVTVSTSGTALTGAAFTTNCTGTYPLPISTTALFNNVAVSFPAPVLNATGPISNGVNYAIPLIGEAGQSFDDNDNSGVLKYVSIRHSGAILAVGAEINGLTLASVGRGTTIDHIEIVSCADDNIEIFGGTVNLKYITTLFGNDDMFDYDLGWKGKAQFFFGMKNTSSASPDNDNGIEADSHDNNSMTTFRSHPVLFNFTIVGNGKATPTSDNRSLSGVNFKEGAEGELYNSIIANFKNGINLVKSTSGVTYNSWHNWRNTGTTDSPNINTVAVVNSLKIKCNTILMNSATTSSNGLGIDASSTSANATAATTATGGEMDQFTADLNTVSTAALPGFSYAFTATGNTVTVKNDVTPNPALGIAGCPTVPVDGFFEPANYRGAFSSVNGENWLSNWTYSQVLNSTSGVRACPTDLNLDGVTNVSDFLIFAPAFNTSCN